MNTFWHLFVICYITLSSFTPVLLHANNDYKIYREAAISSAAGTPWSAKRHLELVKKAISESYVVDQAQKATYPINEEGLHQLFAHSQHSTVPLFVYNEMIEKKADSVHALGSEVADTHRLAIAFGIQRVFNHEIAPATAENDWGSLKRHNDLAILNIFHKDDAVLNGALYDVSLENLDKLSKKAAGYDLVPVLVLDWQDALDEGKEPEPFLAYTFQAADFAGESRYTSLNINPIPKYFAHLQKELKHFCADFKAMWWSTTYLADKKTLVNELPYRTIELKITPRTKR